MNSLFKLLRNWTLPISMLAGVLGYFLISSLPLSHDESKLTFFIISHYIQPVLLFLMLFLSFTKVTPHEMHPQRWHGIVLLCQALGFVVFSVLAMSMNSIENRILCEGAMLCFICPTATASSVITGRLGGSVSDVTTYLLICNLMVALIAPPFLTMVEPHEGLSRLTSFFMIMGKIFPLLISPLICAWIVRFLLPKLHDRIRANRISVLSMGSRTGTGNPCHRAINSRECHRHDLSCRAWHHFPCRLCATVCHWQVRWLALRQRNRTAHQPHHCRTGFRTKEYRLHYLARSGVSRSRNICRRRTLFRMA